MMDVNQCQCARIKHHQLLFCWLVSWRKSRRESHCGKVPWHTVRIICMNCILGRQTSDCASSLNLHHSVMQVQPLLKNNGCRKKWRCSDVKAQEPKCCSKAVKTWLFCRWEALFTVPSWHSSGVADFQVVCISVGKPVRDLSSHLLWLQQNLCEILAELIGCECQSLRVCDSGLCIM